MTEPQQRPTDSESSNELRLHLSRSSGGITNTTLDPWEPTFEELCQELSKGPPVGKKDGSYFVRGQCIEGENTRSDANISFASVVVLDCDSRIDPQTGQISEGAPDPQEVQDALTVIGITHCLYTTHSHDQKGKGNRYRVVLPAVTQNKGELKGVLEWIFHRLVEQGCYLVNVKENSAWSQPWYFPRRVSDSADYIFRIHKAKEMFDVSIAMEWYSGQGLLKTDTQVIQAAQIKTSREPNSKISQFNEQNGNPSWMLSRMHAHGYALKSTSVINEKTSYRLLSPQSSTGNPGIVLFRCDDGGWRVFSHHSKNDPIAGAEGRSGACDAFDLFRILDHAGDIEAAIEAWEKTTDKRPLIRLLPGQLPQNVSDAIGALATQIPPVVFKRAQELVRVAHMEEEVEAQGCTIPVGTAHILPLTKPMLSLAISKAARIERYIGEKWRAADPSGQLVSAVFDGFGLWEGIHSLTGINESPILREDGVLHDHAGYDLSTKLYVEGRTPPITLPDRVSLEQAKKSAKGVLEPFDEFPFVDPDLDKAVVLALLLTLIMRPQLPTAPLFCFSATTAGSGKGLAVEIANMIVRGRDAATMPAIQGRGGEEETRKRITALLSQGIAAINLDNWTASIGGESMNALLTATEWTDRILSRSITVTLPVRCTLMATGNNLTVRGDMVRRSLVVLIDPKVERPEQRSFKQKDLPQYVLSHRGELLRDLFIILKGYQQAGMPGAGSNTLGRFEPWTDQVCGPIRWLGYPDPLASQERLRELDPVAEKLGALMQTWYSYIGVDWCTAGDVIKEIDEHHPKDQAGQEALKTALQEAVGDRRDQVNRRSLGWYLKHHSGRMIDPYRLERRPRGNKSKQSQQYRVIDATLLDR